MFSYDKEYVQQRMIESQKEARQSELARRCLTMKKKKKKSILKMVMSSFTSVNANKKQPPKSIE